MEETYSKQLGKLAKQCGSSTSIAAGNSATTNTNGAPNVGPLCTFTPLWQLLKTSCEKVAQLQLQMAQKLNEMVKDVGKYSDELARKHKVVKESESNTVDAIQVNVDFKFLPVLTSHLKLFFEFFMKAFESNQCGLTAIERNLFSTRRRAGQVAP